MRLTLRTLLAYLDDRLSPANARELGQKMAKSPFATELADRIKGVVRRRRLASDFENQKSIDANLIAEYLDDQLTPELVALIEKEILGSDHNLAEVAAAHQILGLLNDPVEINEQLKGRLYKLDPAVDAADEAESAASGEAEPEVTWQPLAPQVLPQKRSPMLLLLVMVIGWLALLFTDAHLFRGGQTPIDDAVANIDGRAADLAAPEKTIDNEAQTPPKTSPVESRVPGDNTAAAAGDAVDPESVAVADATTEPMKNTTTSPEVVPEVTGSKPPETASDDSVNAKPAVAATGDAPTPKGSETKPPPTAAVDGAAHFFEIRDPDRMLVVSDAETSSWAWATTPEVGPNENWKDRLGSNIAVISEPFRARVIGQDAGWSAIILGSSVFRLNDEAVSGVELIEGRMVLQRDPSAKGDQFALSVDGHTIIISIPSMSNRIGIMVTPLPQAVPGDVGSDDATLLPTSSPAVVSVFAADDDAVVTTVGREQPLVIVRGNGLQWETFSNLAADAPTVAGIPEWVFQATQPVPESTAKLIAEAATDFRQEASVNSAAIAVSGNRNPQLAAYAVRLTALTGNMRQLISFLLESEDGVVRREAILGLQQMVLHSRAGGERVAGILETRLSQMELENAMKLLAGVSRTAAEDRFVSTWLVEMLESNRVALREMAIVNLEGLTNERNGYFADDDGGRRASAVRRWQRFVERNGGRIVKPPE